MSKHQPDEVDKTLDLLMADRDFRIWVLNQALSGRITEMEDSLNAKIIEQLRSMPEYIEIILFGPATPVSKGPAHE